MVRENEALGARFAKREHFLLIVTIRGLFIGGGQALQRLIPEERRGYPDAGAEHTLPLSNVSVIGIEELERLVGAVRAGEVNRSSVGFDRLAATGGEADISLTHLRQRPLAREIASEVRYRITWKSPHNFP